jgi:hypothetical protein
MSEAKKRSEKKIGTPASYPAYYLDEDFIDDKQGRQWNQEMNDLNRNRYGDKKDSRPNALITS